MTKFRTLCHLIVVAMASVTLSACITVFPKAEPSQLYRFGNRSGENPKPATTRVGVVRIGGSFALASAGDGILTTTGTEVAYLAGARWAQPASTLFDEAITGAFGRNSGIAQLVARSDPARAGYTLRVDVQGFEAVYDRPGNAAPQVLLTAHLVVARVSDRVIVADRTVSIAERATGNRVSAIVLAFDTAVGKALAEIIEITNTAVAS